VQGKRLKVQGLQPIAKMSIGQFSGKKPEELCGFAGNRFASRDFEHGLGTLPMS
jgi:hypothetical protein